MKILTYLRSPIFLIIILAAFIILPVQGCAQTYPSRNPVSQGAGRANSPAPDLSVSLLPAPSPVARPNIVVDHTNWDWYNTQPQPIIDLVAAQKVYFAHASIGENIMQGFTGIHNANPSKYPLGQVSAGASPPATTINGTIYEYDRGNPDWAAKVSSFEDYVNNGWHYSKVNIVMNKLCAIDQDADWAGYCDSLASLEVAYPDTRFVYMTIPYYTGSGGDQILRNQFNRDMRNWIAGKTNKLFFDIADIEAWNPGGGHETFVSSGTTYEKMYSGYSSDGVHLNAQGSQRLAAGLYSLFGQVVRPVLAFTTQPSESAACSPFTTLPVITLEDADGNTLTSYPAAVSLAITPGAGADGAVLSGNTTVNAANGVAAFNGLSINKAGTGYSLTATAGSLTSADSRAFTVLHPGDANRDGTVNVGDVTKVERVILGLDPLTCGCDANGDFEIDMGDVTKIERIILGLDPLVG